MILLGHLSYTSYPKCLRPWVLQKGLLVPLQKPKYIYKSLFHSYSFAAVLLFSIWQPHLHMQGHHITGECMFTGRPLNDYQLDHQYPCIYSHLWCHLKLQILSSFYCHLKLQVLLLIFRTMSTPLLPIPTPQVSNFNTDPPTTTCLGIIIL